MWNNKIKGILSLISAVLIHLLIGNLFSFSNFIPYYKSYLYYKNNLKEIISDNQLYFIAPSGIFIHNTLPSITGFLDKKLGIRILTIIGVISLLGSQFIMYYFIDYFLLIISYILFGFCGSLTYFQTVKNCWKYFPNKKGLISGIIFSSFGLSSFTFTAIGDLIINPKSIGNVDDKYYPEEISNKYLDYIKFYILCIIVMGTLSSILSFPYQDEIVKIEKVSEDDTLNLTKENDLEDNEKRNSKDLENNKEENEKNEEENEENEIYKENKLTLKEILLSKEFYKCLTIAGCTLIFGFLLSNTYRNFGKEKDLNERGMQILSKLFTLLNTFSRLLWGYIYDKFGFRIPYIIICINQLICGSLLYTSSKNIYTYIIVTCFGVLSYAGHIIVFPNLIHQKFGVDNSVIILGICGILGGIACILGPILTLFIIDQPKDYLVIYLIGTGPTIVSLILTFLVRVDKKDILLVKLKDEEDEEEEKEEKEEKKEEKIEKEEKLEKIEKEEKEKNEEKKEEEKKEEEKKEEIKKEEKEKNEENEEKKEEEKEEKEKEDNDALIEKEDN